MSQASKITTSLFLSTLLSSSYASFNLSNNLTVDTSYGVLTTTSHEYVYRNHFQDSYLSRLDWEVSNVPVLKTNIDYRPFAKININFNSWVTVQSRIGSMEDYDWLYTNGMSMTDQANYTHWSIHDNTSLRRANQIDINSGFKLISHSDVSITPTLGYQANFFEFLAQGGTFLYGLNNPIIIPNNTKTIRYKQYFSSPYIGLNSVFTWRNFSLSNILKYSVLAKANDEDVHYLRDTNFYTKAKNATFTYAQVMASYKLKEYFVFHIDAELTKYESARGNTKAIDYDDGTTDKFKNMGGLDNKTLMISSGVSYKF